MCFADQTEMAALDLAGNAKSRITFDTRPERGAEALFEDFGLHAERLVSEAVFPRSTSMGWGLVLRESCERLDAIWELQWPRL